MSQIQTMIDKTVYETFKQVIYENHKKRHGIIIQELGKAISEWIGKHQVRRVT